MAHFWYTLIEIAILAQLVEHSHGKGEVAGSIPADGSFKLSVQLNKCLSYWFIIYIVPILSSKNKKSFTVIEFVVAVAIMLILIGISLSGYEGFVSESNIRSSAYDLAETSRLVQSYSSSSFLVEDISNVSDKKGTYIIRMEVRNDLLNNYYVDYIDGICRNYEEYEGKIGEIYADTDASDDGCREESLLKNIEEHRLNAQIPIEVSFCLLTRTSSSATCVEEATNDYDIYSIFPQPGFVIYSYAFAVDCSRTPCTTTYGTNENPATIPSTSNVIGARIKLNLEGETKVSVNMYETGNITVK